MAILKTSDRSYRIFDSYARNLFGMLHAFGKCILIKIPNIHNLAERFQAVSLKGTSQFELKGVKVYLHSNATLRFSERERERNIYLNSEILQFL